MFCWLTKIFSYFSHRVELCWHLFHFNVKLLVQFRINWWLNVIVSAALPRSLLRSLWKILCSDKHSRFLYIHIYYRAYCRSVTGTIMVKLAFNSQVQVFCLRHSAIKPTCLLSAQPCLRRVLYVQLSHGRNYIVDCQIKYEQYNWNRMQSGRLKQFSSVQDTDKLSSKSYVWPTTSNKCIVVPLSYQKD